jgi:hypothetical protein
MVDVLGMSWQDCKDCAEAIARSLGHAAAAAASIGAARGLKGKLQPNMRRGTRKPIVAALWAHIANILVQIHLGGNAIRDAQISCPKCCGFTPSDATIEDLQRQLDEHKQIIEDLQNFDVVEAIDDMWDEMQGINN